MNRLHVSIVYNYLFKNLSNLCCSSLNHKNIIIHLNQINIKTNQKNSGLYSKSWYNCLEEKILFALFIIKQIQDDEIVCISDCDVYCFDPNHLFALTEQIYQNELDILGMTDLYDQYEKRNNSSERIKFNCGFFLARKTTRTLNFLKKILLYDFEKFKFGEQDIVNEILLKDKNLDLKYDILPPDEYLMGCYFNRLDKNKTKLIHTTCTHNLIEKQDQLNRAFDIFEINKPNWKDVPFKNQQTLFYTNGVLEDGSIHYHI
jgi:hypothetical protein